VYEKKMVFEEVLMCLLESAYWMQHWVIWKKRMVRAV